MYAVINGVTKKIKQPYCVVNGVTRKCKAIYAVVNGTTKLVWQSGYSSVVGKSMVVIEHDSSDYETKICMMDINNDYTLGTARRTSGVTLTYSPITMKSMRMDANTYLSSTDEYLFIKTGAQGYGYIYKYNSSSKNYDLFLQIKNLTDASNLTSYSYGWRDMAMSKNGKKLFVVATSTDDDYYYDCALAEYDITSSGLVLNHAQKIYSGTYYWAVETVSYSSMSISVSEEGDAVGIAYSNGYSGDYYEGDWYGDIHYVTKNTDGTFKVASRTNDSFYHFFYFRCDTYLSPDGKYFIVQNERPDSSYLSSGSVRCYYCSPGSITFMTSLGNARDTKATKYISGLGVYDMPLENASYPYQPSIKTISLKDGTCTALGSGTISDYGFISDISRNGDLFVGDDNYYGDEGQKRMHYRKVSRDSNGVVTAYSNIGTTATPLTSSYYAHIAKFTNF